MPKPLKTNGNNGLTEIGPKVVLCKCPGERAMEMVLIGTGWNGPARSGLLD